MTGPRQARGGRIAHGRVGPNPFEQPPSSLIGVQEMCPFVAHKVGAPKGIPPSAVLVVLVSVIAVAAVFGSLLAFKSMPTTTPAPIPSGTFGPFLLNTTQLVGYSFPDCAFVTVAWHVVRGQVANFSVWPPEAVVLSNCHGPAPSNAGCPISFCGVSSMGPGPVCFEIGTDGSCTFSADQSGYSFTLLSPEVVDNTTTYFPSLGNLTVSFVADYGPPPTT
jgi:hypothetical protein